MILSFFIFYLLNHYLAPDRRDGNHFIYFVLDWSKPDKAAVTAVGTVVLAIVVHTALFAVQKLRVFIHHQCGGKQLPGALVGGGGGALSSSSPAKQSTGGAGGGGGVATVSGAPPSHISMVLGEGYSNEGYVKGGSANNLV